MLKFFVVELLVLLASSSVLSIDVDTELGRVRGANLTSRLGSTFHAFRGIRYAEPPLGDLRFLNPQPVKPWSPKTFDATEDGPMCPQPWDNMTDVSEDCLRLNVYTKDLKGRRPVIVFLHPGGFYVFSGQSKYLAGPEHFMDRDCVLVSLNYRLGSLGFLATGTKEAPGNAGMKDQVLALRWIQRHIHRFGGDPGSVTLLGYSAGSISVALHMLSPMSQGLFHRGISMSAAPYGPVQYKSNDLQLAKRQAGLLKCPQEPVKEMVDCMRQKPYLDYVSTYNGMFEFGWNPVLNWRIVVEEDFGQERYLIESPFKTARRGDFYKVPIITGVTEFEFLSGAFFDLRNESIVSKYNQDWEHFAPISLIFERNSTQSQVASRVLREKYMPESRDKLEFPKSLKGMGELYSDALIGVSFNRFLRLMAPHTPIYTYLFRYKGRYSFLKNPDNQEAMGPVHHDELIYLFHVGLLTPLLKREDPENFMIELMTRMWFEFAQKGNPHNKSDEYLKDLNWPLYNSQDKAYLEIGTNLTAKTGGFFQDRYHIWDELFPLSSFC
ncbi:venom carboxylesterase-6 [Drosophila subpulchrella]|uniref:venom carboxylesterase-6 n=1 Tax=Drosophila subpulchrella TaxID=1486046 RepID=UPI0018A14F47|nr:venom carboxylesterase-6 [Drosophila subpulchrella]